MSHTDHPFQEWAQVITYRGPIKPLIYSVPLYQSIVPYQFVSVSLGNRSTLGLVLTTSQDPSCLPPSLKKKLKPLFPLSDTPLILPSPLQNMMYWTRQYYRCTWSQIFSAMIPAQFLKTLEKKALSHNWVPQSERYAPLSHVGDPQIYWSPSKGQQAILLDKLNQCLTQQQDVLWLVPDHIRLQERLSFLKQNLPGFHLDVLSGQNASRSAQVWLNGIHEGRGRIVTGIHTAVFCPFQQLGLIIVEEEHDYAYKIHVGHVRLNIRDLAILRASLEKIPCLLISDTPSLETLYHVYQNRYQRLVQLNTPSCRPIIQLIDARQEIEGVYQLEHQSGYIKSTPIQTYQEVRASYPLYFAEQPLAPSVLLAIQNAIEKKETFWIVLNQKGQSHKQLCLDCRTIQTCVQCFGHAFIKASETIWICTRCGTQKMMKQGCQNCQSQSLLPIGLGLDRIYDFLKQQYPDLKIAKMANDFTSSQREVQKIFHRFHTHEIQGLVGTEKLLRIPFSCHPSLMVVVHLDDVLWCQNDPRVFERTVRSLFIAQQKTSADGCLLCQTWSPHHPLYQTLTGTWEDFAHAEFQRRLICRLPPYFRDILMIFTGKNTQERASRAKETLIKVWSRVVEFQKGVQIFGPYQGLPDSSQELSVLRISALKTILPNAILPDSLLEQMSQQWGPYYLDVDPHDYRI